MEIDAVMVIEAWWYRIRALRLLREKLLKLNKEMSIISEVMAKLVHDNITFEDAQVTHSLTHLLTHSPTHSLT